MSLLVVFIMIYKSAIKRQTSKDWTANKIYSILLKIGLFLSEYLTLIKWKVNKNSPY